MLASCKGAAFAPSSLFTPRLVHFSHTATTIQHAPRIHPHQVPRRPRPTFTCKASDAPTQSKVILDQQVCVQSDLPLDKTRQVLISLKAEDLGGRKRRVSGSVRVESTIERVWHVITSYGKMHLYIPNIVESTVQQRGGVLYLDQIGIISRKLALKTRMLMRVTEDLSQRCITFSRVEGRDFSEFEGRYVLTEHEGQVVVGYDLVAVPFPLFPMWMVERKTFKEVPRMLAAIREEAILGKHVPFEQS